MSKSQRRRILAVASGGGHWVQLGRLSPLLEQYDTYYVTTLKGATPPVRDARLSIVREASRQDKLGLVWLTAQLVTLLVKFRPNVIISTGAAPGYLALRLGKLTGARTIWLDSIANVEELSLSGEMARGCADLWLTQWPHLTSKYPGLRCEGAVL